MQPHWVVSALDVTEARHPGLGPRHEPSSAEQLRLQVRQEAFGHGVVVGIADRAHRRPHSGFATSFAEGHGRVLEALDAVVNDAAEATLADGSLLPASNPGSEHPRAGE